MSQFDLNALLQTLASEAEVYFRQRPAMSDQDVLDNLHIVREFNQIAVNLMREERTIELPGNPMPVDFDQNTASQVLRLFHSGMMHCLDKCLDFKIPPEAKPGILQPTALEIYNQAKQVTLLTFGQERTPGLQVSEAQQQQFMLQGAEGNLIHFVGEYERQLEMEKARQAPFAPEKPPAKSGASPNEGWLAETDWQDDPSWDPGLNPAAAGVDSSHDDLFDSDSAWDNDEWLNDLNIPPHERQDYIPLSLPIVQPETPFYPRLSSQVSPPPHPQQHAPPTPLLHKYAAVALLLETVNAQQQRVVMAHFKPKETGLIQGYAAHPERIGAELDIRQVEGYLRQFKDLIEQGQPSLRPKSYRRIQHLAHVNSRSDMLSCIQRERPRIQNYIEGFYTNQAQVDPGLDHALPPQIEDVLFQHLQKALSYKRS